MKYFRDFEKMDAFGFKNSLNCVLGEDFVYIQRKFIRPKAEDIIKRLENLKELGIELKKVKYFKDTKELKNIEIYIDKDKYSPYGDLTKENRASDKLVIDTFRYIYNRGFDIYFKFYEPEWQHKVGGVWTGDVRFVRIGREAYLNEKIEYNNQYTNTFNLVQKYKGMYTEEFPLEDPENKLTNQEKLIMWLRHKRGQRVQFAHVKPGWGQHPHAGERRGTIYCENLGYYEHPFYEYNRMDVTNEMEIKDVDRDVIDYIWGILSYINEKNYPFVSSKLGNYGDPDYFYEYYIYKF